ncbi:MAG: hypothetical protein II645_07990 [Bacteroidaceae bacterium]|nr:hypothetical protein [Bacteroidaceae bacterium]
MKKVVNLVAVVTAFVVGLAIHTACAESIENMTNTELQGLVASLQQDVKKLTGRVETLEKELKNYKSGTSNSAQLEKEVENLQQRIALLERTSGTSSAFGFDADGLKFFPDGSVCSPRNNAESSPQFYIRDGKREESGGSSKIDYQYDSKGRISKVTTTTDTYQSVETYTYNGKIVNMELKTTYKNENTVYGYGWTYHYK